MAGRELDRLERAVMESRAEFDRTLAELGARLSPDRLAAEAVSAVRLREGPASNRKIAIDYASLAVAALAAAWLLWSQRRAGRYPPPAPRDGAARGEVLASGNPSLPKAAE